MDSLALSCLAALWMGALATLSPCPMTANVAAVGMIAAGGGRRPMSALVTAAAFGAGRMLVYAVAGALILRGAATASGLSAASALPRRFAGPIFLLMGALLLDWVELPAVPWASALKRRVLSGAPGPVRTFFIGCVFAMLPCPETAALFVGGMIPTAMHEGSVLLIPAMFGLGSALPLMALGAMMSLGIGSFARRLGKLRRAEALLRGVTCAVFIAFGAYLTLTHVWMV